MKEKIGRLARGIVESELPVLSLKPDNISLTISYDDIYKSEVYIKSEGRLRFRGIVISSNPRVVLTSGSFAGTFAHITYSVDSSHLEIGDAIYGEFSFVTSAGEFTVPYEFFVEHNPADDTVEIEEELLEDLPSNIDFEDTDEEKPNKDELSFETDESGQTSFGLDLAKELAKKNRKMSPREPKQPLELLKARRKENEIKGLRLSFDKAKLTYISKPYLRQNAVNEMQKALDLLYRLGDDMQNLRWMTMELAHYSDSIKKQEPYIDYISRYLNLKKCFNRGCRSPYLYVEACVCLNKFPNLLSEFGNFEVQTINYGSRFGAISAPLLDVISSFSSSLYKPSPVLMLAFKRLYKDGNDIQILSSICNYLISTNATDESAFRWYKLAIIKGADASRLYDFYLMSMPSDVEERMPEKLYTYYSLSAPSNDELRRKLYANVVKNFSVYEQTYRKFEAQISRFVSEKIFDKQLDEELATLYDAFLKEDMIDTRSVNFVCEALMSYSLDIGVDGKLVITYDELDYVREFPIVDGRVIFPIYTPNYNLKVISGEATYNANSLTPIRLISSKDSLISICKKLLPQHIAFVIARAFSILDKFSGEAVYDDEPARVPMIDRAQFDFLYKLTNEDVISKSLKYKIVTTLLTHYNFDESRKAELLDLGRTASLTEDDKLNYINNLIKIGLYAEADSQVKRFGIEKIASPSLLEVYTNIIVDSDFEENVYTTNITFGLFDKGIYNITTLGYLCKNFNGPSASMDMILKAAIDISADIYDLPERLLCQMLFSGISEGLDRVFRIYASSGSVSKTILHAYYVVKCSNYFKDDEPLDMEIFETIKSVLSDELLMGTAPIIMQLAISKKFSEMESLSVDDENICRELVLNLTEKGIVFPYVKKLSGLIELPSEVRDKTFVTYNGQEGDRVTLVVYGEDDDAKASYMEMTYVYAGIFIKPVLLFKGEHIYYEIRVLRAGESLLAEEGELTAEITDYDEERKFTRLDKLYARSDNADDTSWQEEVDRFLLEDALTTEIFL